MGNNFTHSPASDEGRRQLNYTRLWIDRFSDLGIVPVRIFAGKPAAGTSPQVALRNVIENVHEVLPHAERRGVMLGMENHDFTSDVDRLLELVQSIDSDWFGITWDSANLAPTPDPYRDLERIAPYAITAQIKVSTRVNGQLVPADFPRLIGILRAARFRGYVVLEYEEPEEPLEAIPGHLARLRQAIDA